MEISQKEILHEAQCIYDAVCDSAMENGRDMPWWSELADEQAEVYLERAKRRLVRQGELTEAIKGFSESEVAQWIMNRGYVAYKDSDE
jgi:hypothetical protein